MIDYPPLLEVGILPKCWEFAFMLISLNYKYFGMSFKCFFSLLQITTGVLGFWGKKRPNNTLLRSVHATLRKNDQVLDDMLDDFDDNIRRYSLNENQENDMESAEGQQ